MSGECANYKEIFVEGISKGILIDRRCMCVRRGRGKVGSGKMWWRLGVREWSFSSMIGGNGRKGCEICGTAPMFSPVYSRKQMQYMIKP